MKISLIKCLSYDFNEVSSSIRKAVDLLGGIKQFVQSKEKILIKPNLLSAREPERAITTHPEVVRAVVRLIREAGATPIIGDSPGGAIKGVERVWERTGMKRVASEENVELVNFESCGSVEKKIDHPRIHSVNISKIIFDVDGIINLPKLKTHNLTIFTGGVKNLYGCIPGLRKAEYHKLAHRPDDFGHLIAELYNLVKNKVRLNIMDGIMGMHGSGPSAGDLIKLDMIIASSDAVAMDTSIVNLFGYNPKNIEIIKYLERNKAGETDTSKIQILGDKTSEFDFKNFKFPSNWYANLIPNFLVNIIGKYIWLKPAIIQETCVNCLLCVNSCPVKAIISEPGKKPFVMNETCISCLCCHELCPHKAIELKSSFLSKILIRQ